MPKRLLLAEDSLTIQKVFELTFAQSDVVVTTVDNGEDAIRLAGETDPDLVVADLTLPGKNGFEVAAALRGSGIPVLVLSGTLGNFDEEQFRNSGARGVLFKPFESQELIDKVNEAAASRNRGADASAPAARDEWDFSDVREEADVPAGLLEPAERSAGPILAGAVSGPSAEAAVPPPPPAPEPAGFAPPVEESPAAWCGDAEDDSPSAVTDLSPALSGVESLEDLEDLEAMEILHKESEALAVEEPAAGTPPEVFDAAPEPEPEIALVAEPLPEPPVAAPDPGIPEAEPVPESVAATPLSEPEPGDAPGVAAPAEAAPLSAGQVRELFSGRVREAVEAAATEAVERAVWEMTERFSAEFSARIREAVEAVAWEVIPRTAETLIKEEIERLRAEGGGSRE